MKKYVSVATFNWLDYPGVDYTDILSVTEPCDCPSMREIVARHISGLDPGVSIYDDYDDEYQHLIEPGMDYFDVADMHRNEVNRLQSLDSQAMAERNLSSSQPTHTSEVSEEEGDTSEKKK